MNYVNKVQYNLESMNYKGPTPNHCNEEFLATRDASKMHFPCPMESPGKIVILMYNIIDNYQMNMTAKNLTTSRFISHVPSIKTHFP